MFDLVESTNNLLKAIASVQAITEDICPHCLTEMEEVDRDVEVKYYPVSGPEVTRVNWIKYRCPECGEIIKVSKS